MLFVKDFELGSKLSSACVDLDRQIEFNDENSDPDTFSDQAKMVIIRKCHKFLFPYIHVLIISIYTLNLLKIENFNLPEHRMKYYVVIPRIHLCVRQIYKKKL